MNEGAAPRHAQEECGFDHEKLEVYREAISFVAWLSALLEASVRVGDVKDHLDRASTSIFLNIAEGKESRSATGGQGGVNGPNASPVGSAVRTAFAKSRAKWSA